jgi:hypothetical protein
MSERKVPARPQDCHTIQQKLDYSTMIRSKWDALADCWAPPSAMGKLLDEFPYDPAYPHSHPEWAAMYTRAQAEKERALKRQNKRQP